MARNVQFKVVLVRLVPGGKSFDTFVFLDSGSGTTYIRQDFAKTKLGLGEPTIKLLLKTYNGSFKKVDTNPVDFEISTRDGKRKFAVHREDIVWKN